MVYCLGMADFSLFQRGGKGNYSVQYTDPKTGKRKLKSTGTADKRAAFKVAEDLVKSDTDVTYVRSKLSVSDLIDQYLTELQAKNPRSKAHKTYRRVLSALPAGSLSSLEDRMDITRRVKRLTGDLSQRTARDYITRLKGFGVWIHDQGYSDAPLLNWIKLPKARESELKHVRGCLTQAELKRLLRTTEDSEVRGGLTGEQRALLYQAAASTGLRLNELLSLTWSAIKPDHIVVPATVTKNGKSARQPISSDLYELMIKNKSTGRIWPASQWYQGSRELRKDQQDAGIPYRDEQGHYRDFHSLRSLYVTRLLNAGVPIHDVQRLARHSTPVLTLAVYAKTQANSGDLSLLEKAGL